MKNKKLVLSRPFEKAFAKLPKDIRETVYQKIELLLTNPAHPSLQVKKMKGTQTIWEMRLSLSHRVTFEIGEESILLRKIGAHDILRNP